MLCAHSICAWNLIYQSVGLFTVSLERDDSVDVMEIESVPVESTFGGPVVSEHDDEQSAKEIADSEGKEEDLEEEEPQEEKGTLKRKLGGGGFTSRKGRKID